MKRENIFCNLFGNLFGNFFNNPMKKTALPCGLTIGALIFVAANQKTLAQEETAKSSEKPAVAASDSLTRTGSGETNAEQYQIGPGDVLDVRIFNRPLLSRDAVRVDGRGMIRLPLIGEIRAGCRTESELAGEIIAHYLEYLKNPQVEVFIKDYQSRPVMIIGAVREPGRFQLQRRVRLLELLSLAGGPTDEAGGRIQVKHAPDVQTCDQSAASGAAAIAESKAPATESVDWYDIDELLESASGKSVSYVQPGDTVNLLEADKAFVVGNVVKPSTVALKERVTISKAVAMAGGTLPDSKLDKVRIIRQTSASDTTKTELIVDLRAINRQQAEDVELRANDIVDVPTSNGKKFLRGLMNSVAPTITRLPVRIIN